MIKPAKIIDADDAFFYTKEWQEGEAEADKDIKGGKLAGSFSSADVFINDLEK